MARKNMPAPVVGAGTSGQTKTQDQDLLYRPWARPEISNYPLAAHNAATLAVEFAEVVFELDAEVRGLDWASTVQRRCDARPDELHRRLPPGMIPHVRALAERMVAHG